MAKHEIKTRLSMEGEQQYRSAMKEAANSIKVLDSELKLAESQFKKTGDAQEYLTKKAEILQKEIAAQKEAVAAAEKALADMAANGVDKNDRKYQQWQTTLNQAKTKLNNLESAAKNTASQIKSQGNSAETAAGQNQEFIDKASAAEGTAGTLQTALAQLGANVSLQGIIDSLDNVEQKMIAGIKKAAQYAKAVYDMGTDAGKWADDIATEASKYEMDVEEYQKLKNTSRVVDTPVDSYAKEWTQIQKSTNEWKEQTSASIAKHAEDAKNEIVYVTEAEKRWNELGVATREAGANYEAANPEFLSSKDILMNMVDVLHNMTDKEERAAAAVELLGNNWRDFMPLILAGSEGFNEAWDWFSENATVSQENVDALGALNDEQEKLDAQWQALQETFWAQLAPGLTELVKLMGEATGKIKEFMDSAEGQEAMSSLNDAISGIVGSLKEKINGETFANAINAAKDAISALTSALEWAGNNGDAIVKTLEGVAGAIAGIEAAKTALNILQLINNFKTLGNLKTISDWANGAGGGGGGNTPAAPSTPSAPVQPKSNGSPVYKKVIDKAGEALATTAGATTAMVAGALGISAGIQAVQDAANKANFKKNVELTEEFGTANEEAAGKVTALSTAMSTLNQALNEGYAGNFKEAIQLMSSLDTEAMLKEMPSLADTSAFETWERVGGIENWLTSGEPVGQQAESFMNELVTAISTFMAEQQETLKDSAKQVGLDVDAGMAEGIGEGTDPVTTAAGDLGETSIDKLKETTGSHSPSTITHQIGLDMDTGLANGIAAGQSLVVAAAAKVAQAAVDKIKATLKIHSPSKVAEGLGGYFDAGFVNGLLDGRQRVQAAVNDVLSIAGNTPAPAYAYHGAAPRASAGAAPVAVGGEGAMNATIVMDKQIVGQMVAPIVNAQIGAMIKQRR